MAVERNQTMSAKDPDCLKRLLTLRLNDVLNEDKGKRKVDGELHGFRHFQVELSEPQCTEVTRSLDGPTEVQQVREIERGIVKVPARGINREEQTHDAPQDLGARAIDVHRGEDLVAGWVD